MIDVKLIKKPGTKSGTGRNGISGGASGTLPEISASLQSLMDFNAALSGLLTPCDKTDNELSWLQALEPDGAGGIKAKSLKAKVGLWTDSFLSCLGKSDTGGSGGGGGGLVESIYRWADLGGTFSDTDNDTFNAYTLNRIYTELTAADSAISARLANFYTKSEADGRYALSSALANYVTLNTEQIITARKNFSNALRFINTAPASVNQGRAIGISWHTTSDTAKADTTLHIGSMTATDADGDISSRYLYLGWGTAPWAHANNLTIGKDIFKYKGNDILHAYNYASILDGRYVKKVGDTMTGTLTVPGLKIVSGYDAKIIIDNTDDETYWNLISFRDKGVEYGKLGTQGGTNISWNGNLIFHGGNYASLLDQRYLLKSAYTAADVLAKIKTVDGAASGLDADMLDGCHKTDIYGPKEVTDLNDVISDGGIKTNVFAYAASTSMANKPLDKSDARGTIGFGMFYALQLSWNYKGENLFMRAKAGNTGAWQPWHQLAYTTDNVASADKLSDADAFKAWGQIFFQDGKPKSVNGNMTGVGTVTASGEIKSTAPSGFRIAYANYGLILRNDGNNSYFLLTDSGDANGNFNSLRPFLINNSTGRVSMNNGMSASTATISGLLAAQGGVQIGATADYGWYLNSSRLVAGNGVARGVNVGSLLVSNAWADADKVPASGIYVKGGLRIGDITIYYDAANGGLHVSGGGLYADTFISALGVNPNDGSGTGGGGGMSYDRLDAWADYSADKAGYVLSALLGNDLYQNKLGKTEAQSLYQPKGSYVTLNTAQTISGSKTFSNGFKSHYGGGSWISMATRTTQILGDSDNTTSNAHSLFMLKNSSGSAVAYGGLGVSIGFYGFTKARIDANTNGTDWSTVWNVNDGTLTHSAAFVANTIKKAGGTSSQFLKADGSVDGNSYLLSSVYTASDVLNKLKTVDGTGSGLDADLLDGYHETVFVRDRDLGSRGDYQHVVFLLWKDSNIANHHIQGKLFTMSGGGARYQAAAIDIWFSRWSAAGYDWKGRFDTWGLGTMMRLVTCTYNGEKWWAVEHTNTQAIHLYFTGTAQNVAWTMVHYYTSNTSTVVNSEIYSSREAVDVGTYTVNGIRNALVSDTVANASALGGIAASEYLTKSNYAATLDGRYVNKAGDTVTGALTIQTGVDTKLVFNNTDGEKYTRISFRESGTEYAAITASKVEVIVSSLPFFAKYFRADTETLCPKLNADLLDGLHSTSFLTRKDAKCNETSINDLRLNMGSYDRNDFLSGQYFSEYPSPYGVYLSIVPRDRNCAAMLFIDSGLGSAAVDKRHVFVNTRNAGDGSTAFNGWQKLAYVDDNVASATKLQTARTLWGRSFDGTANVSGDMTGVGSITATGSIRLSASSVLQFKEAGYGDKFGIWGDFNGFDDENRMYIGSATGAAGTDPALSAKLTMLLASGYIGLGTGSPTHRLHVNGYVRSNGLTFDGSHLLEWDAANTAWKFNGNLYATGGISALGITELSATEATVDTLNVKSRIVFQGSDSPYIGVSGTSLGISNKGPIIMGNTSVSSRVIGLDGFQFGAGASYYVNKTGDAVLRTLGVRGTIKTAASIEIKGAVFTVEGTEIYVTIGETKYKLTKTAVTA